MSAAVDALAILYQGQFSTLTAHLQRLLGDRAQAEDLAQQAGLKLLQLTPEQRAGLREPRAFLYQIATNLARDALRRRCTAEAGQAELARDAETLAQDPESITSAMQELARVRVAIAGLPPQARAALLLARVEGLSHKAIAARLGVQPKTVENYLARAITGLHRRLGEQAHAH